MIRWLTRKLTNDYKEIPLILVTFNLEKYKKFGNEGSCDIRSHPYFKDDKYVQDTLKEVITHIRSKYDMDQVI